MWIIEDLKNATFPVLIGGAFDPNGRELQEIVYLPYIDVSIEPGENYSFDIQKLDFDYDAYFVDETTLKIAIKFIDPVYVSAGQPEDYLIIKF